jgi:hypothetical protein
LVQYVTWLAAGLAMNAAADDVAAPNRAVSGDGQAFKI